MDLKDYLDELTGKEKTYVETLLFRYKKQTDKSGYEYIGLNEIINTIRSETLLDYLCNKPSLPSFNPSSTNDGLSGLIHFDIDLKDNDFNIITLSNLKKKIRDYHYTVYEFKSPNGGVKFAVYTDIKTKEKYENAYKDVKEKIINDLDLDIVFDDAIGSVGKTCFLSADKNVYFNNNPERLEIEDKTKLPEIVDKDYSNNDINHNYALSVLNKINKDLDYGERFMINKAILSLFGSDGIEILLNHWTTNNREKLKRDLKRHLKECKREDGYYLVYYHNKHFKIPSGKAVKKLKPIKICNVNNDEVDNNVIKNNMKNYINGVINNNESILLKSSLGSGKTFEMIKAVNESDKKFLIVVKGHKLADEIEVLLDCIHIKGKTKLCKNNNANIFDGKIPNSFCQKCPLKNQCEYIQQFKNDRVRLMTFNELYVSSGFFGDWMPDKIIIDEDYIDFDVDLGDDFIKSLDVLDIKDVINESKINEYSELFEYDFIDEIARVEYNRNVNPLAFNLYMFIKSKDENYLKNIMLYEQIKDGKKVNKLMYIKSKEFQDKYKDIPKLVLDGTGNKDMLNIEMKEFVFNKSENIKTKCFYNGTVSQKFINEHPETYKKGIEELCKGYGKVGIIGFKNCEEITKDVNNYLGNIRGSNEFEDVDLLIVHRYQTPAYVLKEYAFALTGRRDINVDMKKVMVPIYGEDGVYQVPNYVYVDETMEMLRRHYDIAENLQAVHRGRLIYGKPKIVVFLSNVSLGKEFPITEFLDFDDYFSIKEEKKEKELQNKINDVDIKAFENKPKILKEVFGFSERDLRDHYEKCIDIIITKGFTLGQFKVKDKKCNYSTREIYYVDDVALAGFLQSKCWNASI